MLKKLRKSSSRVTLVLIGVAALTGCGKDERRDVYASKEDCLADWGNKPADCTPATDDRHRSSGFFYGPLYAATMLGRGGGLGWNNGTRGGRALGTTSTSPTGAGGSSSRGGFGSSGISSAG
jgi:uncharacterized protein YgiB involved in biofilm formation